MSKSRKQILQELLDLEDSKVEEVEKPTLIPDPATVPDTENTDCITRAKKPRSAKQLEAFDKAKAIRDANAAQRKKDAADKAEEERKLIESKLIKKAIALKKKQIKKQAVIDEISDDDTPIEKIKEIATKQTDHKADASVPKEVLIKPIPLRPSRPIDKYKFF